MTSAASVAKAAPPTPIANEKIKIGSSKALKMFANALTFTGVPVSSIPASRLLMERKQVSSICKGDT